MMANSEVERIQKDHQVSESTAEYVAAAVARMDAAKIKRAEG